jgi:hypothetical protein
LAGETELARPGETLSRRQRSLLRLIDGQRTLHEVLVSAHTLGLSSDVFFDLMQRGLVALQAVEALQVYDAVPLPRAARGARHGAVSSAPAWRQDVTGRAVSVHQGTRRAPAAGVHSPALASRTAATSVHGAVVPGVRGHRTSGHGHAAMPVDPAFDEARALVSRALRLAAPWRSSYTRWRVFCARDRRALCALLPAVRRRLAVHVASPQLWPLMRRVELLMMPSRIS